METESGVARLAGLVSKMGAEFGHRAQQAPQPRERSSPPPPVQRRLSCSTRLGWFSQQRSRNIAALGFFCQRQVQPLRSMAGVAENHSHECGGRARARARTAKNIKSVTISMNSDVVSTLHMVQMLAAQFMNRLAPKRVTRIPCRVFMTPCEVAKLASFQWLQPGD